VKKSIVIILLAGSLIGITRSACACTVPVFRYSLERWPADPYGIFVLHGGDLSAEDNAVVDGWIKIRSEISHTPIILVETVNIETDTLSGFFEDVERPWQPGNCPRLIVKYAGSTGINRVVLHEKLSMKAARARCGISGPE